MRIYYLQTDEFVHALKILPIAQKQERNFSDKKSGKIAKTVARDENICYNKSNTG